MTSHSLTVEDVEGFWMLTSTNNGSRCFLGLRSPGDSSAVNLERCKIDQVQGSTRWVLTTDGFHLVKGDGHVTMRFRRLDVDTYVAVGAGYRLTRGLMQ